jgi:hypothetical protein
MPQYHIIQDKFCFRSQARREAPILLDPLERTNPSYRITRVLLSDRAFETDDKRFFFSN